MRTIAIAAGGDSSEYEISVKSAEQVSSTLSARYVIYIIMIRGINWYWEDPKGRYHNVDKNDFTLIVDDFHIRFDAVFIAIHGTPGENGLLQGYFDILKIPYTSCDAFCSALTFNKQACKLFLKDYGLAMADSILIRKGDQLNPAVIVKQIGLPCFVKPNDSGSSFGVSKIKKKEELFSAIEKSFNESDEVIVEAFMEGREVACGVVRIKSKSIVLPVTEIISSNEFFDFDAKYHSGKSQETTPARLTDKTTDEVQKLSLEFLNYLDVRAL